MYLPWVLAAFNMIIQGGYVPGFFIGWKRTGLMVSALVDSGSSSLGSSTGGGSLARHSTLTVPLSTQEHKWYQLQNAGG